MEAPSSFTQKNKNFESLRTKTNHDLVSTVGQYSELQPGILYALDPEQFAAKEKVEELGELLAEIEGENLIKLRDDLLTNAQIAEKLIPDINSKYPGVAATAVSYALGLILGEDKRKEKTTKVISALGKTPNNIERLKKISKEGMDARLKKYGKDGVFRQQREGFLKGLELQGKKILSEEEKQFIIKLCEDKKYRDSFGKIKRSAIADEVNAKFRNGENVRKPIAIADCYRRFGHKK